MYGVPSHLPLDRFVGKDCTMIGIGQFQLDFTFQEAGIISVFGRWELRDHTSRIIDQEHEPNDRDCYRVHQIFGSQVIRYEIDAPTSFTLYFENGYVLTIFDDSEQYESFSIQPDGIYI